MAKLSIGDRNAKNKAVARSRPDSFSPDPRLIQIDDVFSVPPHTIRTETSSTISTSPISPSRRPSTQPGGEMERIRQAMLKDHIALVRDAENRRPEYLKRIKRSLSEADPTAILDDGALDRDRGAAVGIMESPHKGRRLKLFQETSEESFEESLMAGGYGRYVSLYCGSKMLILLTNLTQRTADWVRQPQPLAVPAAAGPSNIAKLLAEVEAGPPTEKELKKRKRLEAFRSDSGISKSKLYPVEIEGKGRVLLEYPNEDNIGISEPTPSKKRNRRKKKGAEPTAKERKPLATPISFEEAIEKPNWPDAEFPWRLRTEERAELAKVEEENKMHWIERFLDRDTDDEDDSDEPSITGRVRGEDEEALPAAQWGAVYEEEADRPVPVRTGRGKMVPLLAHPEDSRKMHFRKRTVFPSDPADARAALLSKKSVRALSYRQQRRQRELADVGEDEVVCICRGKDDGRELVQCDGCQTWYHLQCIGIRSISELGKEEDPWFCRNCVSASRSPSPEPDYVYREPTFVPTDEGPRTSRSYDAPFFQPPMQDSPTWNPPRMPKTPTRGSRRDLEPGFSSSSSSWFDSSSRHGPLTPQHQTQGVRIYTPGAHDGFSLGYEESPFDPTSTPSRGIKINAPFATPKNNVWASRANGLFHTPSKPSRGSSIKTLGGPGSLSLTLDESAGHHGGIGGYDTYPRPVYDESPVRRKSNDVPRSQRVFDSPSMSRGLDESSMLHLKGKERLHDNDQGAHNGS